MRTPLVAGAVTIFFALLFAANLPFYAGSSTNGMRWRMEHGRITVQCSPGMRAKGFWVNLNSEALRWRPEWRVYDARSWTVVIPLWWPLVASAALTMATWRRSRRSAQ